MPEFQNMNRNTVFFNRRDRNRIFRAELFGAVGRPGALEKFFIGKLRQKMLHNGSFTLRIGKREKRAKIFLGILRKLFGNK